MTEKNGGNPAFMIASVNVIEPDNKCSSMEVLLDSWNSPEYQEAIKLRAGVVESNFTGEQRCI
jgi:hypothetical protein